MMFSWLITVVSISTDSVDTLFFYLLFEILSNFLFVLEDLFAVSLAVYGVEEFVSLAEMILDLGVRFLLKRVFLAV